jgi:hypothetical protein
LIIDVLDGEIEIRADLFFLSHEFKKTIGEMVCFGVGIEDSNPAKPFHFDQISQEFFQTGSIAKVPSISGGILSNQDEFLNSSIRKSPGLFQDGSKLSASITTPDLWNRAKGTGIGTTLCNLQISNERRGGKNSRRPFIMKESGLGKETLSLWSLRQQFGKVLECSRANEEVYLW